MTVTHKDKEICRMRVGWKHSLRARFSTMSFRTAGVSVSRSAVSDSVTLRTAASPGSSVHGILQARMLEWLAMPFSRGSSQPKNRTLVSYTEGKFFTIWTIKNSEVAGHLVRKKKILRKV